MTWSKEESIQPKVECFATMAEVNQAAFLPESADNSAVTGASVEGMADSAVPVSPVL